MAEVIGAAVLTAVGAAEIAGVTVVGSVTVATVVGTVIIAGGSIGLQMLLQRQNEQSTLPSPQAGRQALRQAVPARFAGFSRCRIAGAHMLYEEREKDFFGAQALCEGPIVGFVDYYLHDDKVGLSPSGFVEEVLNSSTGAKNDGRYQFDTVRIQTRLGEVPSDAEDTFVGQLPDLWTNDHRGDGIACAYLHCQAVTKEQFESRYPHGLPQLSVVADLLPCWDPRSGVQSRTDSATWTITANPILQLLRFLTDTRIGMGFDYDEVIAPVIERWKQEANLCDTEEYESAGFYRLDTDPSEVLAMLLATCDGWIAEDGEGRVVPVVGSYREPAFVIEDKHILGFSFRFGVDDEAAVNELKFTYTSPEHDYNEVAGDPWRDEADISARGRIRSQDLALTWVQDHTQGRKLVKRAMERLTSSARGKLKVTLYGLGLLGKRWVGLRYPFLSAFENAVLEIENVEVDLAQGCVTFDWVKVDGVALSSFNEAEEGGEAPPTVPGAGDALITDDTPEALFDDAGEQVLEDT